MKLTDFDKELLDMTTIPENVLQILKDAFELPILQYFGYSEDEMDYVPYDGICVNIGMMKYEGHEIRAKVRELSNALAKEAPDYTAFASEYFIQLEEGEDCVAIIKTSDWADPIRAAGIAGFNAQISNQDIIDKLTSWKKDFDIDFKVIYCDMQQVDLAFLKKPKDIEAFAEEVHDFAPDLVDRLPERETDLITIMNDEDMFSLYWD